MQACSFADPDNIAAACAGQAMHDFVAKCLNKDPAARMSASELLRHPFLAHAKDERYLAQYLLGGPSPVAPKSARSILSRMPGGDTALVRHLAPRCWIARTHLVCMGNREQPCCQFDWQAPAIFVGLGCRPECAIFVLHVTGAQHADGPAGGGGPAAQDVLEGQGHGQEGVHRVPGGVDGLRARPQVLHRLPHGAGLRLTM